MDPEGSHARDLVDEVSKRFGGTFSVYRIASYLGKMFVDGEVWREAEEVYGSLTRYRWFRK